MRRPLLFSALAAGFASAWGCQHSCSCYRPCPAPPAVDRTYQPPVLGVLPPHSLTPEATAPVGVNPMPPGVAIPPPPPTPAPAAPVPAPGSGATPAPVQPPAQPPANAPARDSWYPPPSADNGVRLAPPTTTAPQVPETQNTTPQKPSTSDETPSTRLYPPSTPEPPLADPAKTPEPGSTTPAPATGADTTPALPVGIAGFAQARDGVTSGLKPSLDGLDWLKAKGYRAVLHLKSPGEADSPDRSVIERRGLTYLTLDVSPELLNAKTIDAFNKLVGETANQPLFVYDRDGALAGALWYLNFRTVERQTDEAARLRAARLGLSENPTGEQQALWLAIQKYLSQPAR